MPKVTMTEFEVVPPGLYPATLVKVENKVLPHGPVFNWVFALSQAVGKMPAGTQVSGITSQTLSDRSKMAKWLEGFGISVQLAQTLELNDLVGRQVAIEVIHKPSGDNVFANVADVKSMATIQAFQAVVAPPVQPAAIPVQPAAVPVTPVAAVPPTAVPVQPVAAPSYTTTVTPPVTPAQPVTPAPTTTTPAPIGDDETLF